VTDFHDENLTQRQAVEHAWAGSGCIAALVSPPPWEHDDGMSTTGSRTSKKKMSRRSVEQPEGGSPSRATTRKKARRKGAAARRIDPQDLMSGGHEFLNRDLSWLEFNSRVLHEAEDARTPLLERVRFLGIYTSNLDEFFMKRVAGLRAQVASGSQRTSAGQTPVQLLASVRKLVMAQQSRQARTWRQDIKPELKRQGIEISDYKSLSGAERLFAARYFRQNIFPVLTPLAVDPGLPFPFISNMSISLGVTLRAPDRDEKLFARIKVPKIFPHWIQVPREDSPQAPIKYVSLLDVIEANLRDLFPDMEILDVMPFRVTRNVEVERDEEDAEDLLEMVAEELKQRRFGEVVRLEHGPEPDAWMLRFLMDELELTENEVYELPSILDFSDLKPIIDAPRPDLKFEPWTPLVPPRLIDEQASIFSVIRQGDLLVHHPFESFGASVERFIREAVEDHDVLAIKMTLYRTGDDSPFIPLLIRAAEQGKQVVVLIELKARFDEERNIHWAQELENAGVHVVYGVVGLKTHAKVALVVRREAEGVRSYAHLGTGNYHKQTAKLYTDVGLLTAREEFVDDVVELFHFLTGRSLKRSYRKLLVAPHDMKPGLIERIRREVAHARAGRPARIIVKCNSLEERDLVRELYAASSAGVEIDLIVRGFCCLRPKVKGMSERIRVISVIGRFLEHSRILYFANGSAKPADGEFLIGSADLMYRNLLGRIETMTPVEDTEAKLRLWELIDVMLADRRSSWDMQGDGSYVQYQPRTTVEQIGTHQKLMSMTRERHREELAKLAETSTPEHPATDMSRRMNRLNESGEGERK